MTAPEFGAIDRALTKALESNTDIRDRWLIEQTVHTADARRNFLHSLPIEIGWTVLDVGTGYGVMPLEIASLKDVKVHGVDTDEEKLGVAEKIRQQLADDCSLQGKVVYERDDIYRLHYSDSMFDLSFARFIFQHLAHPLQACQELYRVTKSGGFVCVMDADDSFSMMYPEVPGLPELQQAYAKLQEKNGGDRFVGRKVPHYLQQAGFEVTAIILQPVAVYQTLNNESVAKLALVQHISRERCAMIETGVITAEEFERSYSNFADAPVIPRFQTNSQVVVMARKQ